MGGTIVPPICFTMATINEYCEKATSFLDGIIPCIEQTLANNRWEVVTAIREQLYSGVDGNEHVLRPTYTGDPYFKMRYKNPQVALRKAAEYRDWKNDITPPETSRHIHFSPRGTDTPNLFIDGTFHRSIVADVSGGVLRVNTEGFKDGRAIEAKYGTAIFKVSNSSWEWIIKEYVAPELTKLKLNSMR